MQHNQIYAAGQRRKTNMRIILTTCGSRGDVQPMIALTLALQQKGHHCLLAGPPEKAGWAKAVGCDYRPFGQDVTAMIDAMDNVLNLRSIADFFSFVRNETRYQLKALPAILKTADKVVASSLMFGASTIAEQLGVPYQYVAFTPQLFASGDHPFPVVKQQRLPRMLNRASWTAARFLERFNITSILNRYRRENGLSPLAEAWDHILGDHTIVACDRQVASVPDDVSRQVVQTGYLHLDVEMKLDSKITAFIEKGGPIVYAGFGSMPPADQKKRAPVLIEAAKQTGCRMIIAAFWESGKIILKDPDILFVRQAPHRLLFPLMDVIIHHGGAGTTATATAAGKPQIIVPHILDQYYHGQKLFESGIATRPIRLQQLNSRALAAAVEEALTRRSMRSKAREIGESIKPERSLKNAVRAVEN
jgi:UDP:flavonoid glycosyltransferase YjiC (YdhE family)